jgi:hypothetical protein
MAISEMSFYVVVRKITVDNTYLPTYEIAYEKPAPGVKNAHLTPGDYVYVSKCSWRREYNEVVYEVWKVSNEDGKLIEELTETFTAERQ